MGRSRIPPLANCLGYFLRSGRWLCWVSKRGCVAEVGWMTGNMAAAVSLLPPGRRHIREWLLGYCMFSDHYKCFNVHTSIRVAWYYRARWRGVAGQGSSKPQWRVCQPMASPGNTRAYCERIDGVAFDSGKTSHTPLSIANLRLRHSRPTLAEAGIGTADSRVGLGREEDSTSAPMRNYTSNLILSPDYRCFISNCRLSVSIRTRVRDPGPHPGGCGPFTLYNIIWRIRTIVVASLSMSDVKINPNHRRHQVHHRDVSRRHNGVYPLPLGDRPGHPPE